MEKMTHSGVLNGDGFFEASRILNNAEVRAGKLDWEFVRDSHVRMQWHEQPSLFWEGEMGWECSDDAEEDSKILKTKADRNARNKTDKCATLSVN